MYLGTPKTAFAINVDRLWCSKGPKLLQRLKSEWGKTSNYELSYFLALMYMEIIRRLPSKLSGIRRVDYSYSSRLIHTKLWAANLWFAMASTRAPLLEACISPKSTSRKWNMDTASITPLSSELSGVGLKAMGRQPRPGLGMATCESLVAVAT